LVGLLILFDLQIHCVMIFLVNYVAYHKVPSFGKSKQKANQHAQEHGEVAAVPDS